MSHHPKPWHYFAAGNAVSCCQLWRILCAIISGVSETDAIYERQHSSAKEERKKSCRRASESSMAKRCYKNPAKESEMNLATNGNVGFAWCDDDGALRTQTHSMSIFELQTLGILLYLFCANVVHSPSRRPHHPNIIISIVVLLSQAALAVDTSIITDIFIIILVQFDRFRRNNLMFYCALNTFKRVLAAAAILAICKSCGESRHIHIPRRSLLSSGVTSIAVCVRSEWVRFCVRNSFSYAKYNLLFIRAPRPHHKNVWTSVFRLFMYRPTYFS